MPLWGVGAPLSIATNMSTTALHSVDTMRQRLAACTFTNLAPCDMLKSNCSEISVLDNM